MITLEVCANSVTSALAAQNGGAVRVELCGNLHEGGTTPSLGQVVMAKKLLSIPVYPIIRPREGVFLYTELEFEVMKNDVANFITAGCDGIVIGLLNTDGTVDKERSAQLVDMAKAAGKGVTFHRAFDMCRDHFEALEDIISIGCERILTSGGRSTAIEGANVIAHLIKIAANRIQIMPGSGVNEHNIADLVKYTGATEFHSSAKIRFDSGVQYRNDHILLNGFGEEYTLELTDAERVRRMIDIANG